VAVTRLLVLVSLAACSDPPGTNVALCAVDASADATTVDAGPCSPNPVATFPDPTGLHPTVTIQKPADYSTTCATPRPILLVLGGYGSDTGFGAQIGMGWRYLKDIPGGVLILAPDGAIRPGTAARYWNADPACCDVGHVGNDDVAYLGGLIESVLAAGWNVDRTRVFVAGRSNGGFMAHRLACGRADLVTAIVDLAGAGRSTVAPVCLSTLPVAALVDHSQADAGIKYPGGTWMWNVLYPSTLTTLAQRAAQNGCTGQLELVAASAYDHDSAQPGAETDRLAYTGCPVAVEHWREPNSAHVFPQTTQAGTITTVWGADAWAWLMTHPR